MSTAFDPAVVQLFAERLLTRARRTVLLWTFLGAVLGLTALAATGHVEGLTGFFLGTTVGAIIGAAIGQARAFSLRLAAHQALCQLAIERHLGKIVTGLVQNPG